VTLTVNAVNDRPMAAPDAVTTPHETPVEINVLVNDTDVDGDVLGITGVAQPTTGTASFDGGRVRFQPVLGFSGTTSFSYTITDGLLTDTGLVTVTVGNPEPTASPSASPASSESPAPSGSFAPTSPPTPTPTAGRNAAPDTTREPTSTSEPAIPRQIDPPAPPVVVITELQPLIQAQLTAGVAPGQDSSFSGFQDLFGGFSGSGFAWAVPAAMLGLPGLLFMVVVAVQVLGAAAWVPAIRRQLGGVGANRRRAQAQRRD